MHKINQADYVMEIVDLKEKLEQKIADLRTWLRDHPTGNWEARYDKIQELARLQNELEILNQ